MTGRAILYGLLAALGIALLVGAADEALRRGLAVWRSRRQARKKVGKPRKTRAF